MTWVYCVLIVANESAMRLFLDIWFRFDLMSFSSDYIASYMAEAIGKVLEVNGIFNVRVNEWKFNVVQSFIFV